GDGQAEGEGGQGKQQGCAAHGAGDSIRPRGRSKRSAGGKGGARLRDGAGGFADDESHGHAVRGGWGGGRRGSFGLGQLHQPFGGAAADGQRILRDGREARAHRRGELEIGEADHGDVGGHRQAEVVRGGEHVEGDPVVEGDDGGGRVFAAEQRLGVVVGFRGSVVLDLAQPRVADDQPVFLHGAAKPVQARPAGADFEV